MEKFKLIPPKSVEDRLSFRKLKKGETIICQGDESCEVYVLLEGTVKVMSTSPSGIVYVTHYMEAIGFFGDIEAITDRPVTNTIVAKTECGIVRMDRTVFFQWLQEDWRFLYSYISTSAKRLTDTDERAKKRYINTVDENIWQIIQEKSSEGVRCFEKSLIEKEVFSTSRSINRSLKKYVDAGVICIKKGMVYIIDAKKADVILKKAK